jgi:hypothetical protein
VRIHPLLAAIQAAGSTAQPRPQAGVNLHNVSTAKRRKPHDFDVKKVSNSISIEKKGGV